jgi:hypothetical protein
MHPNQSHLPREYVENAKKRSFPLCVSAELRFLQRDVNK